MKVDDALNNYSIKRQIENITVNKINNELMEEKHIKLKNFFNILTSMLIEEGLTILLLDNNSKIIDIQSTNNENYNTLHGSIINIDLLERKNLLSVFPYQLNIKGSKDLPYRLLLLGLNLEMDILKNIYNNLVSGLNKLYIHDKDEHNDYHNLVNYLDSVDEGISACDENGIITYINKSACNMLNTSKEEMIGQKLSDLSSNSILVKVVASNNSYLDVDYFLEHKNKRVHLINSAYPVYDEENKLIGAVDIHKKIKRSIKLATDLGGYIANYKFDDFIGESKTLSDAIDISKKFAGSNKNVLIIGDSGTGKELFAQSIHNHSVRNEGPFVAINCASYPKDLFESELFGYEEGAFTGAKKGGKTGKFELASGGTLFLDEIGEMPLNLQAKLLRIIESKRMSRIGGNKKIDIDVRIISATNRNLEEMVANNSFREDLYYRLKVLFLNLEPLKNRENDIFILCDYFINKFSRDSSKNILGLNCEARDYVSSYDWPGNIRELENIISLSLFYCEGNYITKEDLIKSGLKIISSNSIDNSSKNKKLSTITNEIILQTLDKNNGNKKKTAEELGISRNTIYRML